MATVEVPPERRHQVIELVDVYDGRVLDVGPDQILVSLEDIPPRVDDFEELLRPFGIVNLQRTGRIALPRLHKGQVLRPAQVAAS